MKITNEQWAEIINKKCNIGGKFVLIPRWMFDSYVKNGGNPEELVGFYMISQYLPATTKAYKIDGEKFSTFSNFKIK